MQIISNAVKYCAPGSTVNIAFSLALNNQVKLVFDMVSLQVKGEEVDSLFAEGFSGLYAQKLGYAGKGQGLAIAKRFARLNQIDLQFERNVTPDMAFSKHKIPYENNRFCLLFKQSIK